MVKSLLFPTFSWVKIGTVGKYALCGNNGMAISIWDLFIFLGGGGTTTFAHFARIPTWKSHWVGGGGGNGDLCTCFACAPKINCRFFYPIIGVGVHKLKLYQTKYFGKQKKKKKGNCPNFARILPKYCQNFTGIRYIGKICGWGHSAPLLPPPPPRLICLWAWLCMTEWPQHEVWQGEGEGGGQKGKVIEEFFVLGILWPPTPRKDFRLNEWINLSLYRPTEP